MKLTRDTTPLTQVERLDESARSRLSDWHITSAEQLLGALYSSPEQIGDLLGLQEKAIQELKTETEEALDPAMRDALAEQVGRQYPVGGLKSASDLGKRSSR